MLEWHTTLGTKIIVISNPDRNFSGMITTVLTDMKAILEQSQGKNRALQQGANVEAANTLRLCREVVTACHAFRLRHRESMLRHLPEIIGHTHEIYFSFSRSLKLHLPGVIKKWSEIKTEQGERNRATGHLFNPLALIPIGEV